MCTYLLPRHVHVHVSPDASIFLDLRRDKYVGLDESQTRAMARLVRGWEASERLSSDSSVTQDQSETSLAQKLLREGLLTSDESTGKTASSPDLTPVHSALADLDVDGRPAIQFHHVLNFFLSSVRVRWRLKHQSLETISDAVLKAKSPASDSDDAGVLGKMHELTHVYEYIRPFFYTQREQCLFDSMALVQFLASYNVFPTLVLGVRAMPFEAHAWVQYGPYVLNGMPEYIRLFKPIAAF